MHTYKVLRHGLHYHLHFSIISHFSNILEQNTQTDIAALLEIRAALNDSHGVLSSWTTTTTAAVANASSFCSSWRGVTCTDVDQQPRVSAIHLPGAELRGYLSEAVGNLGQLQILSLRGNHLSGSIPVQIGDLKRLRILDLSRNLLTGTIPPDLGALSKLSSLSLSNNLLSGQIPVPISNDFNLAVLLLRNNQLNGSIPNELGALSNLEELDLGMNQLSGSIPPDLANCSRLSYLSLDRNNLLGEIPGLIPTALATRFNASSFAGNPLLCGTPLTGSQAICHHHSSGLSTGAIVGIAVGGAGLLALTILLSLCGLCICVCWRRRGTTRAKAKAVAQTLIVMFHEAITIAHIHDATGHFAEDHVISRTRFGILFKATLLDGTVLLVRRLPDGQIGEENFKAEAAMLAKVKHRNLMVLRGCFINEDVRLLLYDYMPNGSLASLLQEASKQTSHVLDWPMRHLIALGIARGISFLHTECNPPIVHGDVKPNNVLFDADFEPHVSDFGLMALTTTPVDPTPSSSSVGSLGYVSPEANDSGELTRESDVYSFGIVLLELLTGRRPAVFNLQDEDIVKWVKRMLQLGEITEVFDPALLDLDPESSEWEEFLLAVKIALLCTAPDPADRPSIAEVVLMLEGCRTAPDIPSSNSPTAQTSPT
ncbi:unnamed protein product [Sphagnum jensenii]|uniref:Protein kinase domain-containing protein n=1 Tax=Sphagnum jensenii TaxID=128206 RepID=A0ABP0XIE9_9BRYO